MSNCYVPYSDVYRGSRAYTYKTNNCDNWANHGNYSTTNYPYSSLDYYYCRNPGGERSRPWCFTSSNNWEYCDIPMCPVAPTYSAQYPLGSKFWIKYLYYICIRISTSSITINLIYLTYLGKTPISLINLNGGLTSIGRVAVYHNGEWGTICRTGLSTRIYNVLCQQAGLGKTGSLIFG